MSAPGGLAEQAMSAGGYASSLAPQPKQKDNQGGQGSSHSGAGQAGKLLSRSQFGGPAAEGATAGEGIEAGAAAGQLIDLAPLLAL